MDINWAANLVRVTGKFGKTREVPLLAEVVPILRAQLEADGRLWRQNPQRLREVEAGAVNYGVVPVENSTEGVVNHTLDSFMDSSMRICGEVVLRIHQHLLVAETTRQDKVSRIYSHPQSFAQCRKWLDAHFPHAERVPVSSNAEAARLVKTEWHSAAIAGDMAAKLYGLTRLAEKIEDSPDNSTRFLIIGNQDVPMSGEDKTSIVVAMRNQPGALHEHAAQQAAHPLVDRPLVVHRHRLGGEVRLAALHQDVMEARRALAQLPGGFPVRAQQAAHPRRQRTAGQIDEGRRRQRGHLILQSSRHPVLEEPVQGVLRVLPRVALVGYELLQNRQRRGEPRRPVLQDAGGGRRRIGNREPERRPLNLPRPLFTRRGLAAFHRLPREDRIDALERLSAPSYPPGAEWDRPLTLAARSGRFRVAAELNGAEQVICATGFQRGFRHDPLLAHLVDEHELETARNWIVLAPDATVPALTNADRTLALAGVPAQWAFPGADTLAGHRYVAHRFLRRVRACPTR